MRTGRPKKPLELMADEREKLDMLARRPKTSQRMAQRAKIVLLCAEGRTNRDVARYLHVSEKTVGKWRERFRPERLEGL
ncbi:MAG: helix-turn-helix domain-containing protein, partial [Planctomycetota bacterium]